MATRAVRERLAHDLGLWLADGLVDKTTHDLLSQRYGAREFGIVKVIKTFGIAGGMMAFFGLLGLVTALSGSKPFAAFLMLAIGSGLAAAGIWLSIDKLGRYAVSSKVVVMLGVVIAGLGIALALDTMGANSEQNILFTGALLVVPLGILAYRFGNTFLLVVGLILFFHWVGAWNQMFGRSTYEFEIDDPKLMCVAALAAILLGICHERYLRNQTGRFFQAYETMGLIYLNMSLLILSIEGWRAVGFWIVMLTAASLAQIVAGAWLHNPLMTGFGVTTFAVNIYTRYYETFWNRMHAGAFFLLGGLSLFLAGFVCEVILTRWQRRPA